LRKIESTRPTCLLSTQTTSAGRESSTGVPGTLAGRTALVLRIQVDLAALDHICACSVLTPTLPRITRTDERAGRVRDVPVRLEWALDAELARVGRGGRLALARDVLGVACQLVHVGVVALVGRARHRRWARCDRIARTRGQLQRRRGRTCAGRKRAARRGVCECVVPFASLAASEPPLRHTTLALSR
jgi:hypothetical protein